MRDITVVKGDVKPTYDWGHYPESCCLHIFEDHFESEPPSLPKTAASSLRRTSAVVFCWGHRNKLQGYEIINTINQ